MDIKEFLRKTTKDSLTIFSFDCISSEVNEVKSSLEDKKAERVLQNKGEDELYCTICRVCLQEENLKIHYKLDWHRYNIQRKIHGQEPFSEQEFLSTIDELSSVSGSDSSSEEEEATGDKDEAVSNAAMDRRIKKMLEKVGGGAEASQNEGYKQTLNKLGKPKVYFDDGSGKVYGVYRCLLSSKKADIGQENLYLEELDCLKNFSCAVIMLGGGHFAAAIFNNGVPTGHKTFHSYTVRAKQGGSQSSRDNKSGGGSHPKSAGASLRRYNEAAFAQHVTDLVAEWKSHLAACTLILYRAVSSNSAIIFGGKVPLIDKTDTRLRSIPMPTRRATFAEVKRVYKELTSVEVLDKIELEAIATPQPTCEKAKELPKQPPTPIEQLVDSLQLSDTSDDLLNLDYKTKPKKKTPKPKKRIEEPLPPQIIEVEIFEGEFRCVDKIYSAIMEGNDDKFSEHYVELVNMVVALNVDEEGVSREFVLSRRRGEEGFTILHVAALHKRQEAVWTLIDSGSDPSVLDYKGRPPYVIAGDKETRNVFRRFMGMYPDRYDYSKSQIPSPLSDDAEKAKAARLAEKKKLQKAAKKEREKEIKKKMEERKAEDAENQKAEEERKRFLQLSDREKRALAAERRLIAQASSSGAPPPLMVQCFLCGADITGKVPFEYSNNLFCTVVCLSAHRKKNTATKL